MFSWGKRTAGQLAAWIRKRGGIGVAVATIAGALVLVTGVGATLAVTGTITPTMTASPTASPTTPTPTQTAVASNGDVNEDIIKAYGGGWSPIGSPGGVGFRWDGNRFQVVWTGKCDKGPISVKMGPQNWGYLSTPLNGIQGLGGGMSGTLCVGNLTSMGLGGPDPHGPAYWKCFNFSEVWVQISGNTPDAGLYKQQIPASLAATNCPAGASSNDPNKIYDPYAPPPSTPMAPPPPAPAPSTAAPSPSSVAPSTSVSSSPSPSTSTR